MAKIKSPFPYFGGKSKVANLVWDKLGDVKQYIEPFFGSGAVLFRRPESRVKGKIYEIVNDANGYVSNVWRSLKQYPDKVAEWCDYPVNHADLSARRRYMLSKKDELLEKLIADYEYCDPQLAGIWIWGMSCWIGGGFDSGNLNEKICNRPDLVNNHGCFSIGKIPHIAHDRGIINQEIYKWFEQIADRLRYVKVVCGDWTKVCGGNWQTDKKPCGMFFDPPYGVKDRSLNCYGDFDTATVANDVRKWCAERGDNPDLRIVLAGYEEHMELVDDYGWTCENWHTGGGYANIGKSRGKDNAKREYLYYSPYCLTDRGLFNG